MKLLSTIALLLLTVLGVQAVAGTTVTLRAESEVAPAKTVYLKDIADIRPAGAAAEKLSNIIVATGPTPGQRKTVDQSYIKLRIGAAEVAGACVAGPAQIVLLGRCVRWTSDELTTQAKEYLLAQVAQDDRTYGVSIDRAPRELTTAAGETSEIRPRLLNTCARLGTNTVALDAVIDGRVAATATATLRLTAIADVLVTTAPVRQGDALTEQNTAWTQREIKTGSDLPLTRSGAGALTWVARRSLGSGRVIASADVCEPSVVHRGDTVTVLVKSGCVRLAASAECRQDGRVGDIVSVESTVSTGPVRAKVVEPGVVEITR